MVSNMIKTDKPRFTHIADTAEAAALQANGKYREGEPHWVLRAGQVWALVDDNFKAWRLRYSEKGKSDE